MSLLQLHIPTPQEQQEMVERSRAEDVLIQIAKRADRNRAAGLPEPKPGDRLYVQLQVGIAQRSRAGVVFQANRRTVVEVVEADAPPEDRRPESGVDACVTPAQAEEILEDTALSVGARSGGEVDGAKLRAENDRLQAEVNEMRAKLRDARMNAKDTGDGKPARLNAARATGITPPKGKDDDFGGDKS